ncbi:MAG: glycosyltransferase [Sphingomonadales bacterium]
MGLPNGISIVICTYNGVRRLRPTLEAIFSLKISPEISWELIIVDNASTDGTTPFCENIIKEKGFEKKARIVFEQNPGCNHARLRGLRETSFRWLLFCDDDNHLFDDYFEKAWNTLNENPEIGALGGQGIALFENEKPIWFDRFHRSFAVGPQAIESGRLTNKFTKLYSAGTYFRKEALDFFYNNQFNTIMVGPQGNDLTRGEDTEWCFMLQLKGYQLWYNNDLKFYHYMTSSRMTWSYYLKLKQGISSGVAKLEAYTPFLSKAHPSFLSFFIHYGKCLIFQNVVWWQFVCKKMFGLKKYTQQEIVLGTVNNQAKALAFRRDFSITYKHFKQIKKLLSKSTPA